MPLELASARVEPLVASYQDLSDDQSDPDTSSDTAPDAPDAAVRFTDAELVEMHDWLCERGLFAFLQEYLDTRSVPPAALLSAFGARIVSPRCCDRNP